MHLNCLPSVLVNSAVWEVLPTPSGPTKATTIPRGTITGDVSTADRSQILPFRVCEKLTRKASSHKGLWRQRNPRCCSASLQLDQYCTREVMEPCLDGEPKR